MGRILFRSAAVFDAALIEEAITYPRVSQQDVAPEGA
jgi:hypothetical protein